MMFVRFIKNNDPRETLTDLSQPCGHFDQWPEKMCDNILLINFHED